MNTTPSGLAPVIPEATSHPTPEPGRWWLNIIRGLQLTEDLTLVAESLATHAHPSGKVSSPGRKKVCQDTGLEPEEVSRAFRTLRDGELLDVDSECDPRTGHTRYLLVVPSEKAGSHRGTGKEIGATLDATPGVPPTHDELPSYVIPHPSMPKPSKRKGIRRKETVLYRYYDDQDVLLYVGITANMPSRFGSHETDSTWMDFAARSTIDHFADRGDALAAEKAAIEEHAPLFNVEHNDRPDRVRRIVDYLIERDRRDLLVPLISRG